MPDPLTRDQSRLVSEASYLPSVLAYRFTRKPSLVADLVSVGYLALCGAAVKWAPAGGGGLSGSWGAFARKCVNDAMISELRLLARRQSREVVGVSVAFVDSLEPEGWPSDLEAMSDLENLVLDALAGDEQGRNVFRLHVVEGRTFEEVAQVLGLRHKVQAWKIYHEALSRVRVVADARIRKENEIDG